MSRFLLFILCCFTFCNLHSQLDREHWFPAMYDGQTNDAPFQYLCLSTSETTPFKVSIYSNNTLIAETSISKGTPQYIPISRNHIIVNHDDYDSLLTPIKKGLFVKGDYKFFANLRFGMINHAEIITSKGQAGLGNEFYAVVTPTFSGSPQTGFSGNVIATEDNTTVTMTFRKPIWLVNEPPATSITFHLNRGESYIADGRSVYIENFDGFIGTKIESDKPIAFSNGNFNGQYIRYGVGSDILMDQSVPTYKLGNKFGLVKGYGTPSNAETGMERAIIVAAEDNTQIFINDSNSPITTLAKGEYYFVPSNFYKNRGNDHYNLYIETSKNAYVYQFLAGVFGGNSENATGGMNYIPPLNCYLPKTIDEIGFINKMNEDIDGKPRTVKLNIITEKGGIVKVNGSSINPVYGPYPLGNSNWETYSVPNIQGNITITSTTAVTAGLAGGDGNAEGYGGYFAGFSSVPLISKLQGECIPDAVLEVIPGFNHYQWLMKTPSGYQEIPEANKNTYIPLKPGIYAVKIQQGNCSEIQTPDSKVFNCVTYSNYDFTTCATQEVTPQFALSSQTLNPASVKIENPPTKGNVSISSEGKILYTANPDASGDDTFKFSFCGMGTPPDCELTQITIHIPEKVVYNQIIIDDATSSVTIYVSGGLKPYYYSMDGINYQQGNVFYNIPKGMHTAYVKDSYGCKIFEKHFLILNLINAITPNNDGINDVLDYSPLQIKNNGIVKLRYIL